MAGLRRARDRRLTDGRGLVLCQVAAAGLAGLQGEGSHVALASVGGAAGALFRQQGACGIDLLFEPGEECRRSGLCRRSAHRVQGVRGRSSAERPLRLGKQRARPPGLPRLSRGEVSRPCSGLPGLPGASSNAGQSTGSTSLVTIAITPQTGHCSRNGRSVLTIGCPFRPVGTSVLSIFLPTIRTTRRLMSAARLSPGRCPRAFWSRPRRVRAYVPGRLGTTPGSRNIPHSLTPHLSRDAITPRLQCPQRTRSRSALRCARTSLLTACRLGCDMQRGPAHQPQKHRSGRAFAGTSNLPTA